MHYHGNCPKVPKIFKSTKEISRLINWDTLSNSLRPGKVRTLQRALFANSEVKP